MRSPAGSPQESAPYQLFMLVLSVYVLTELMVESVVTFSDSAMTIILWADTVICGFFFVDFLRSLKRAPNKKRYMLTWGWIDLLSSIPTVSFLRWGRLARFARLLRILRAVRSIRILAQFVIAKRADTTMLGAVLLGLFGMVTASIMMLQYETGAASTFSTPGDALWWAFVTVTSVGYGDMVPVTHQGRIVATVLMTIGVLLFGTMTAYMASWLTRPQEENQDRELVAIREELGQMNALLQQVAGASRLAAPEVGGPPDDSAGATSEIRTSG